MAKLLLSLVRRATICDLQYYLRGLNPGCYQIQTHKCIASFNLKFLSTHSRPYSTGPEKSQGKSLQQRTQSDVSEDVRPITFKTVKETTKTASYLGVILLGVGVTGIIFYTVLGELFSSKSPNNVYSKALERVCSDTRVMDALGEPISGYGEENRRGRRQHVSHLLYEKNGEKRLRMKFYISGTRKRATVHLEMREDESGNYTYRYLFVELDDFGRHPIIFEDNRNTQTSPVKKAAEEMDLSAPLNMNLNFPDAGLK
ncbi:mitochondrial import inner membrane translocase subunit Tim21 [Homalodisca vitripennis]|uniref:mitochondrial import inner membrane translocase subunit Tim21 n=1 Tax=Homalodisca vitripennis TaxID=197043 RepID=UPI001EEB56EA|nr:mitochondrial import inner membrane translocase subunit Tim21 [Homalodisca vitripennis]